MTKTIRPARPAVRNVSGGDLWVPELGCVVPAGESRQVPADRLDAYTCQPETWAETKESD